jgi:dTDP-4-dehydrorhamnose reductase
VLKKYKIILLGSTGLIGHQLFLYLSKFNEFEIINIAYNRKININTLNLDLRNVKNLSCIIKKENPDIIINAVGLLINSSNKDKTSAILLNSFLPNWLLENSFLYNYKLIQISTDCVFSGNTGNYNEKDFPDGFSIYAKTKSLGEIYSPNHLTIRTSVIGPEIDTNGGELFNWFMNQDNTINGYSKSIWSGITTIELAKCLKIMIDNNITGLYHLTNGNPISKLDLLSILNKYRINPLHIEQIDGVVTNKSFIDSRNELKYTIPDYHTMIFDMFTHIKNNENLYKHYIYKMRITNKIL